MNTKNKLLSIKNLKKYFPIAKSHLFQREQYYVRANEDISLDIYEGETLGLVGESGCGKSTLGRVILQLYEQTAGNTMYSGKNAYELAPKYIEYTLKNAKKFVSNYKKLNETATKLTEACEGFLDSTPLQSHKGKTYSLEEIDGALDEVITVLRENPIYCTNSKNPAVLLQKKAIIFSGNRHRKSVACAIEALRRAEEACKAATPEKAAACEREREARRESLDHHLEKANRYIAECVAYDEHETFLLIQKRNFAKADSDTALHNVASILGGCVAIDDIEEGARLLRKKYLLAVRRARDLEAIKEKRAQVDLLTAKRDEEGKEKKKARLGEKIVRLQTKIEALDGEAEALLKEEEERNQEIEAFKNRYADNEEFRRYEEMLDDSIDLARLGVSEMRNLRSDLQIIFQDPYSSLDPRMTIGQIIEEGLVTHKMFKHGSAKMKDYILKTMADCGLQDYMLHRYPHQFSGGQRQRICIARSLAVKPKFVVCDECVSALDVSIQSQIINLLQDLKERDGLTYLFISHDLSVVKHISDRICVMYLGNIVELADSETTFKDPRHPYTVALLSSIPTTDIEDLKKERIILEGNIPSPIFPPSGCKFHTRCYMACDKCKRVPPPFVEVEPNHFVACHFLDRKIDENGNYLFEIPKTEHKSTRLSEETNGDLEASQKED